MKTTILLSMLFIYSFLQAQINTNEKENNYKWGITVLVNSAQDQLGMTGNAQLSNNGSVFINNVGTIKDDKSFSIGGLFRYYLKNDFVLRLGYSMTKINIKYANTYIANNISSTQENSNNQNMSRYDVGIQRGIKKNFFELYGGLMLSYLNYQRINLLSSTIATDLSTNATTFTSTRQFLIPGGYAAGMGGFIGTNIFLHKHFSIGAEVSFTYCYVKTGGMLNDITVTQTMPNPPQTISLNYEESYKGFRFTNIIPTINASFYF